MVSMVIVFFDDLLRCWSNNIFLFSEIFVKMLIKTTITGIAQFLKIQLNFYAPYLIVRNFEYYFDLYTVKNIITIF